MEKIDRRHSMPSANAKLKSSPPMTLSTPLYSSKEQEFNDANLSSSYPSAKYFITPAIGKRSLTRIPQLLDSQPKKGILKRASIPNTIVTTTSTTFTNFSTPSSGRPRSLIQATDSMIRMQKPSVGFSETQSVAIFGDTSDDNTTENESDTRSPLLPYRKFPPAAYVSPFRQTKQASSEDEDHAHADPVPTPEDDEEEETPVEDDNQEHDEEISNGSSSCSSHIAGKWWFGKSTRYVVHCEKKGCKHHHKHEPEENYMTPTQRKNREIAQLKKDLRRAHKELEEKEKQLKELRDRIKEIEFGMPPMQSIHEINQMKQRLKDLADEHKREKQHLVDNHEIRVRQLIQETIEARTDVLRKNQQIEKIKTEMNVETVDAESNTEPFIECNMFLAPQGSPVGRSPNLLTISESASLYQQQQLITQETLNQLQAYRNEALIWRTKAAQLEIVVKDQLLKASTRESDIFNELEQKKMDNERLREVIKMLQGDVTVDESQHVHKTSIDEATETEKNFILNIECSLPGCIDRKRALIDENKLLLDKIDRLNETGKDLENKISTLNKTIETHEKELDLIKEENDDLRLLSDERLVECQAAQLSLNKIQQENETVKQALEYLENRCQVYQHTLLDHHLVVTDESTQDWRHAFRDPRYMINHSKYAQTDLTSEALSVNEDEFQSLRKKLKEVEAEFSSQQSDMHDKFAEIEENLFLKTKLVESLSRQLEIAAKEAQAEAVRHQKEREIYQKRIDKLGKVAGRVPLLETEIETLRAEKSQTELRFKELQGEYEESLEDSLNESMKRYQKHSQYWQEKVNTVNDAKHRLEAELVQLKNKYDQIFLQNQLERTDLEQKLASSIDHVMLLFNQINIPRRDAQVEARPKQPNSRHKETEIEKGELFNECEERLKICQGELLATRRQVEVLQQKLMELFDTHEKGHFSDEHYSTPGEHTPLREDHEIHSSKLSFTEAGLTVSSNRQDRLSFLEKRNATLSNTLRQTEYEKAEISRQEKEKIQGLISEFESLRKELDQELMKYEEEKQIMKDYIFRLETQFWDSDQLKKKISYVSEFERDVFPSTSLASDSDMEHIGHIQKSASYPAISSMFINDTPSNMSSDTEATFSDNIHRIEGVDQKGTTVYRDAPPKTHTYQEVSIAPWPVIDEEAKRKLKHVRISRPAFLKTSFEQSSGNLPNSDRKTNHHLVSDLDKVQLELEKLLENVSSMSSGLPKDRTETSTDSIYHEALSSLDEPQNLGKHELQLLEQNKTLKDQLRALIKELEDASRELELYRIEPRQDAIAHQNNIRFPKSRSVVDLELASADPMELQQWKEKAGVSFREINRLRRDLVNSDHERRELKTKLAMLRGEMILSRCQIKVYKEREKKRKQDAKRRFSLVSKKSEKSFGSSNKVRSLRESSVSSYMTANFSIASFQMAPAVSDPNLSSNQKNTTEVSVEQVKPHGSIDSIRKEPDTGKELEMVKEAFRRQAIALREKYKHLYDQKTGLEHKVAFQIETLNQAKEKQESLKNDLAQRDEKIKTMEEAIRNVLVKGNREKKDVEDRLSFVQRENSMYERKIREIEADSQNNYLVMFRKGQQAATQQNVNGQEPTVDPATEDRIVLRFLHDAFYYYLLKKGDASEHLQAIMTMLNFTSEQKDEVHKIFGYDDKV